MKPLFKSFLIGLLCLFTTFNLGASDVFSQAEKSGASGRVIAQGDDVGRVVDDIAEAIELLSGGTGYNSFNAFKSAHGAAGSGIAWHHIVEQGGNQVNKYGANLIHNTKNFINVPHGAGTLHARISGYYSSIDINLHPTRRVRDVVKEWTFKEQHEFGIQKLRDFGWDGVTGIIN